MSVSTSLLSTNENTQYSSFRIFLMSCATMAYQFAYAVIFSLVDPLIDAMEIPSWAKYINMALGPIIGFFVQPFVGVCSDGCKSRFGRRRPYIVLGSIGTVIGIIGIFLLKLYYPKMSSAAKTSIFLLLLAFTYTSVNTLQSPARSIISDILSENQQELGNTIVSTVLGLASILPNLLGGIGYFISDKTIQEKSNEIILITGSILICITIPITLFTAKETPFTGEVAKVNLFSRLWSAIVNMPKQLIIASTALFLSWMGYYSFIFKTTTMFFTEIIPGSNAGLCFGMFVIAIVNTVVFLYGIIHTKILSVVGSRNAYFISHIIMGACLIGTLFTRNQWVILCLFAPLGITTTIFNSVPFAIAGLYAPESEMGVYIGGLNCFVVIGQQAANLCNIGIEALQKTFPAKWNLGVNRTFIAFGAIPSIAAAIVSLFLKDTKNADYEQI